MRSCRKESSTNLSLDDSDDEFLMSDHSDAEHVDESVDRVTLVVEKILGRKMMPDVDNPDQMVETFFIKWRGLSWLWVSWEKREDIERVDAQAKMKLKRFQQLYPPGDGPNSIPVVVKREENGESALITRESDTKEDEEDEEEYFDPEFAEVHRIIACDTPDCIEHAQARSGQELYDMHNNLKNTALNNVKYLVKWRLLPYNECTWERYEDLRGEVACHEIVRFWRHSKPSELKKKPIIHPNMQDYKRFTESPHFGLSAYSNNSTNNTDDTDANASALHLRDYQLEGVNWLLWNWWLRRSCVLADEMGLGKTIQTVGFLHELRNMKKTQVQGPFLIIAPLSLTSQWQSEVALWSPDMNCILLHGSQEARDMIAEHELYYSTPYVDKAEARNYKQKSICKFDILLTTYEVAVKEVRLLSRINWQCLIIDEAHRLKNSTSKLFEQLSLIPKEFCLLLTGTPLQNKTEELWSLMHFADPVRFKDQQEFLGRFGDLKDAAHVGELHAVLKPYLLRRIKEDVEKSLPPKEETIIEVSMTSSQKRFYRAIYEKNTSILFKGVKQSNQPSLMNVMMELRKCCNHPYLCRGVEELVLADIPHEIAMSRANANVEKRDCPSVENASVAVENGSVAVGGHVEGVQDIAPEDIPLYNELVLKKMVQASGKLTLLDKLLPRLYEQEHKVLIFSQMVRCLNIIEEYLRAKGYMYERLDGSLRSTLRNAAVQRFIKPSMKRFVMLLSTKAGGLGLNLTAADTVIIFDSDWNPHNDMQAQARAHRIGQTRAVKVYRLLTRKTYEMHMFHMASMKLGMDRAVLAHARGDGQDGKSKNASGSGKIDNLNVKEIDELLKRGAYDVFKDDDQEQTDFAEADIDSILQRQAHVVDLDPSGTLATRSLGSFSKASFVSADETEDVDINDPEFWRKAIGLEDNTPAAVLMMQQQQALNGGGGLYLSDTMIEEIVNLPMQRKRKRTVLFGSAEHMASDQMEEYLRELTGKFSDDTDGRDTDRTDKPKTVKDSMAWGPHARDRLVRSILLFGFNMRYIRLRQECGAMQRDLREIELMSKAYILQCGLAILDTTGDRLLKADTELLAETLEEAKSFKEFMAIQNDASSESESEKETEFDDAPKAVAASEDTVVESSEQEADGNASTLNISKKRPNSKVALSRNKIPEIFRDERFVNKLKTGLARKALNKMDTIVHVTEMVVDACKLAYAEYHELEKLKSAEGKTDESKEDKPEDLTKVVGVDVEVDAGGNTNPIDNIKELNTEEQIESVAENTTEVTDNVDGMEVEQELLEEPEEELIETPEEILSHSLDTLLLDPDKLFNALPRELVLKHLPIGDVRPTWTRVCSWWDIECDKQLISACFQYGHGRYDSAMKDREYIFKKKLEIFAASEMEKKKNAADLVGGEGVEVAESKMDIENDENASSSVKQVSLQRASSDASVVTNNEGNDGIEPEAENEEDEDADGSDEDGEGDEDGEAPRTGGKRGYPRRDPLTMLPDVRSLNRLLAWLVTSEVARVAKATYKDVKKRRHRRTNAERAEMKERLGHDRLDSRGRERKSLTDLALSNTNKIVQHTIENSGEVCLFDKFLILHRKKMLPVRTLSAAAAVVANSVDPLSSTSAVGMITSNPPVKVKELSYDVEAIASLYRNGSNILKRCESVLRPMGSIPVTGESSPIIVEADTSKSSTEGKETDIQNEADTTEEISALETEETKVDLNSNSACDFEDANAVKETSGEHDSSTPNTTPVKDTKPSAATLFKQQAAKMKAELQLTDPEIVRISAAFVRYGAPLSKITVENSDKSCLDDETVANAENALTQYDNTETSRGIQLIKGRACATSNRYTWALFKQLANLTNPVHTADFLSNYYKTHWLPLCIALSQTKDGNTNSTGINHFYNKTIIPNPFIYPSDHSLASRGLCQLFLLRQQMLHSIQYICTYKMDRLMHYLKSDLGRDTRFMPVWWCPWIHDVAILKSCMYYGYINMEMMCLDKRVDTHGMVFHIDTIEKFVMHVFINGYTKHVYEAPDNADSESHGLNEVDRTASNGGASSFVDDNRTVSGKEKNIDSSIPVAVNVPPVYGPEAFNYNKKNALRWHHSVCRIFPDYKDLELRLLRILEAMTHPLSESVRSAAIDYNGGVLPNNKIYSPFYYCHIDTHRYGTIFRNAGVVFPPRSVIRQIPDTSSEQTNVTDKNVKIEDSAACSGSTSKSVECEEMKCESDENEENTPKKRRLGHFEGTPDGMVMEEVN